MKPAEFPPEYEQLLLRASDILQRNSTWIVQFSSPKLPKSIQARFRAYIRALRETSDRPDLTLLVTGISTRVEESALVFFRREDSVDAMAIRDALGLAPGFANGADSRGVIAPSTHLDTLKRIRERK